ncbi:hypothetical protein psyc5s11_15320 [Clostridium gelidum]|uniref:EF-hand domain-containing protein n=1 Tax=Clostridium gelidum TaxID=704125 RepID=A0ABM7T2J7_9CLOT|nr:hypothetical protein [Clostridium gelidum]BCZ45465.1 hypothetical protein psyc5s11_15320 [Clostridium gelidum]
MQTKNLVVYNNNFNLRSKFTKNFKSIKKSNLLIGLLISLLLAISFLIISDFFNVLYSTNNKAASMADFKLDINNLSETALVIESERKSSNDSQINSFGSDGSLMKLDEIRPKLTAALVNIADLNEDKKISNEEIASLEIMRLNQNLFKNELKTLGFNFKSPDCNLNNYIIITQGKSAGTILYNGPFQFIDNRNKRYFGLELSI